MWSSYSRKWWNVSTCPFILDSVPDWYITQELCDNIVYKKALMIKHFHDKYKTQKMCDKAVDAYLLALEFFSDWFFKSKMIEKLDSSVFSNDNIVFWWFRLWFWYFL